MTAQACVDRVHYRGYVQFEQPFFGESLAKAAYEMFRQHNIRNTQKLHPLFARGESQPLLLKVSDEHLEATTCVSASGEKLAKPATVVDTRLSKVLAVAVCKKKLFVFLAPTVRKQRIHCHCFCVPSKQMDTLLCALPSTIKVVRIVEKSRRRALSMPILAKNSVGNADVGSPSPFAMRRSCLNSFATLFDLSHIDDSDGFSSASASAPTSACASVRGSMIHLDSMPATQPPSVRTSFSSLDALFSADHTSRDSGAEIDDCEATLERSICMLQSEDLLSTSVTDTDAQVCDQCQAEIVVDGVPCICSCQRSARYIGAEEVASAPISIDVQWNALTRVLEQERQTDGSLCVNALGVFLEDASGRMLFYRSVADVVDATVVDGFVCITFTMGSRPRHLLQFYHTQRPDKLVDAILYYSAAARKAS